MRSLRNTERKLGASCRRDRCAEDGDLAVVRGIGNGLLLAMPLWGLIIWGVISLAK